MALRVGGVPEHFNAPFFLAAQRNLSAHEWRWYPGGTGAMADALEKKEVDVALMLAEGAVAKIAAGAPLKLCGTYVRSPLTWGVHVHARREDVDLNYIGEHLDKLVFGVSRMGSGSHLMACVMALQRGWPVEKLQFKIVNSLDGARAAMREGEIDVWMWEKFTTDFVVKAGEFRLAGVQPTPWPCFAFVAHEHTVQSQGAEIKRLIDTIRPVCDEFKANKDNATVQYVSEYHKMSEADAALWLAGTEWACIADVPPSMLNETREAMVQCGVLQPEHLKLPHSSFVAPFVRLVDLMSPGMYNWRIFAFRKWIAEHRAATGADPTMADLAKLGHLDQYHYGGVKATEEVAELLGAAAGQRLLDVGSGVGGPARYMCHKYGCAVDDVELQEELVEFSKEITALVKLEDRVRFFCGSGADLGCIGPAWHAAYDGVFSILVILHVSKLERVPTLLAMREALKPDGTCVIEDMVAEGELTDAELASLKENVGAYYVPPVAQYEKELKEAGFVDIKFESLTAHWREWAVARSTQYAASEAEQLAAVGRETFEARKKFYAAVAALFQGGHLGGARITARRPHADEDAMAGRTPGAVRLEAARSGGSTSGFASGVAIVEGKTSSWAQSK